VPPTKPRSALLVVVAAASAQLGQVFLAQARRPDPSFDLGDESIVPTELDAAGAGILMTCGMKVDKAKAIRMIAGQTFYFCLKHCAHVFEVHAHGDPSGPDGRPAAAVADGHTH
jgi:hypothetical protein